MRAGDRAHWRGGRANAASAAELALRALEKLNSHALRQELGKGWIMSLRHDRYQPELLYRDSLTERQPTLNPPHPYRRAAKNSLSNPPHSSANNPPATSGR